MKMNAKSPYQTWNSPPRKPMNKPSGSFFILIVLVAVTSVTLAVLGCTQKPQKPTASQILKNMQQKYESLESYKAEIHQSDKENGRTVEADFIVYFKKPDKFRTDYPAKGIITVWTSKIVWVYEQQKNEVRVRKINASINASQPFDLMGFILREIKKYEVSLAGEEKVNGKDCYVLDLKPSKEELSQLQRVWVVKGEWYPAKVQFKIKRPEDFPFLNFTIPEVTISTIEFRKIELNKVGDEMFVLPENVIVVEEYKALKPSEVNYSTVIGVLAREDVKSEIGEEYEINQYFVKDSTLNILVLTPCADYMVKYNLKNGAVLIDKVNPWKKTIKEEPVTEEEKQKFLAVVLNDSRVKEALKGRSFNVSMVKYVMYAACQKAVDPDSVHMVFKVDSELYRVILSGLGGKLEVVRVEKIV